MGSRAWWGKNVLIAFLSIFFLVFGVNALISAYSTKNPLVFIMYFFSSSLIILISIVGIIYPFCRIRAMLKPKKMDENDI
jgi:predicted membrane protein